MARPANQTSHANPKYYEIAAQRVSLSRLFLSGRSPREPRIHCPPGTMDLPSKPSWILSARPRKPAARSLSRPRNESPPSTRMGHCGSSIRCTRRFCIAWSACRSWPKRNPILRNRSVQDRAFRQSRGYRTTLAERSRENPRGHAHGHVSEESKAEVKEVARHCEAPAVRPAIYRADLSADAGGPPISACQRLQDFHCYRRRSGLCREYSEQTYGIPPEQVVGALVARSMATTRRASLF